MIYKTGDTLIFEDEYSFKEYDKVISIDSHNLQQVVVICKNFVVKFYYEGVNLIETLVLKKENPFKVYSLRGVA